MNSILWSLLWLAIFGGHALVSCQQIQGAWQTTRDRSSLFQYKPFARPTKFVGSTCSTPGDAQIEIIESVQSQTIDGLGATLTDSSALLLNELKTKNSQRYWKLLNELFSTTDTNSAGFSFLRLPLGASDFSAKAYTFADVADDVCLLSFKIDSMPASVLGVLKDILSVNQGIKIHVIPWSPPAWMKTSNSLKSGSLKPTYANTYAIYLLKALQALRVKGIEVYAISTQNQPLNSNPTYPTSTLTPGLEGRIGAKLKELMKENGFAGVKLIGYNHNWSETQSYAMELMKASGDAFDGVAFQCYSGGVGRQSDFRKAYPTKEIYFSECSGIQGSDWWDDIKWYTDNVAVGAIRNNARTVLMWNLALDGQGLPKLPGANSCGEKGCRGVVTIHANGTYGLNQEYYMMAQVSKATITRDAGGPAARRIKNEVTGSAAGSLKTLPFVLPRRNAKDPVRYSLVVLNLHDNATINANIRFQGKDARHSFPVGLSTLFWDSETATAHEETTDFIPTMELGEYRNMLESVKRR